MGSLPPFLTKHQTVKPKVGADALVEGLAGPLGSWFRATIEGILEKGSGFRGFRV